MEQKKLSLIGFSGDFDKLVAVFTLATGAAAVGLGVAVAVNSGAAFMAIAVPGAASVIASGLNVGETVRSDGVIVGTGGVEAERSQALRNTIMPSMPINRISNFWFVFIEFSLTDLQINSGRFFCYTLK